MRRLLRPSVLTAVCLALLGSGYPGHAGAAEAVADSGPGATEARNTEMARRFVDEVYSQRHFDKIPDYVSEEFVDHSPGAPPEARGSGYVRQQAEGTQAAFPDFRFSVLRTVAEGDLVAIHWQMTGTASERVGGPAAAGKAVEVQGISMFRYDDQGKVVESWDLVDRAGMMQQVGFQVTPPGAGGAAGEKAGEAEEEAAGEKAGEGQTGDGH